MSSALTTAIEYLESGLSIIPVRTDGSKAPAVGSWKAYQERRAESSELRAWFSRPAGIAIICGRISGNLEVVDFDDGSLIVGWLEEVDARMPGLVERLLMVSTPADGWHIYYRSSVIEGNQKLAQHRDSSVKTDIETRGEGGYVLAPGSPAQCHPLSKPYEIVAGSFAEIPFFNPIERDALLNSARLFNQVIEAPAPARKSTGNHRHLRPGDDYNQRGDWFDLLPRHGWVCSSMRGEESYWRRPGKDERGWSATVNYAGLNLLYVFSSNCWPFEAGRAYTLFGAYALLEHHGEFRAARAALANEGYGISQAGNSDGCPATVRIATPKRPPVTIIHPPARPTTQPLRKLQ